MFDRLDGDAALRAAFGDAMACAEIDLAAVARDPSLAFENRIAQPLICAWQLALWSALAPRLAAPILFAGYSVGELAAYGCARSLSMADTIALARERAEAMDAATGAGGGGLIALRGLTRSAVESLCIAHHAAVAIVNGDDQIIVGARSSSLDVLMHEAIARGANAQRLRVGVASHTSMLAAASEAFRYALQRVDWRDPAVAVLSGLDGSAVRDASTAKTVLARQISTTIRWVDCMDSARERGADVCLELGPCNALARMMRERHPDVEARSVSDFRSLDAVVEWVERASG